MHPLANNIGCGLGPRSERATGTPHAGVTTMGRILVKNGHILTLDDSLTEFEDGYLIIRDDRIEAAGPSYDGPEDQFDTVIDAHEKLITPGFICAHDHASNYLAAPRSADGPYNRPYAFIWRIMSFCTGWTERDLYINNLVGALRYLKSGVTTILDLYPPFNFGPEFVDWMARAYDASGLRSVLALGLFDEPERAFNVIPPGPHNEVMALLGDYVRPRPLEQIRETLEWSIRTHHLQDGRTSIMLAPRHTFGCSDALHHLIGDLSDSVRRWDAYSSPRIPGRHGEGPGAIREAGPSAPGRSRCP